MAPKGYIVALLLCACTIADAFMAPSAFNGRALATGKTYANSNSLSMKIFDWKRRGVDPSVQGAFTKLQFRHREAECNGRLTIKRFSSEIEDLQNASGLIGEDAALFKFEEQRLASWGRFAAVLGTVLTALYYLWINNSTGFGDDFILLLEDICGGDSQKTIILLLSIFAVAHSGLASLRPYGENIIGTRAWRVLFGVVSLPLALSCLVYFINHRYDGSVLWDIRGLSGVHEFCWISSFISFWFLYPSTFNLLEVAAVDKPQLHLWETGIIRITRHPQFVGQAIWCVAHSLYIGTSFTLITSAMLMGHHLFAVWNGDRRLADKHGEAFEAIKARTSVIPFQAILDGRQILPDDYYKEFARGPYAIIALGTVEAYYLHPYMQAGSSLLHCLTRN